MHIYYQAIPLVYILGAYGIYFRGQILSYHINPSWFERWNQVTIDDLCVRANGAGIASEGRTNLDFSI